MHDIKTFTKTSLNKLKNLCIGDKIELLTYKKDRKITIIKNAKYPASLNRIEGKAKIFEENSIRKQNIPACLGVISSLIILTSLCFLFL